MPRAANAVWKVEHPMAKVEPSKPEVEHRQENAVWKVELPLTKIEPSKPEVEHRPEKVESFG